MLRRCVLCVMGLFAMASCDWTELGRASASEKTANRGTGYSDAGVASSDTGASSVDADISNGLMCKRQSAKDQKAPAATQVNLIADQQNVAVVTDTNLVNAWGLAFNPSGVAWISANGSGLAIAYDSAGNTKIQVTVPPPSGGQPPSAPTGQVFNRNPEAFMGDLFIFATEDGTISGWKPSAGTTAMLRVDNSGNKAVYKGLTIANFGGTTLLLAADFHNGQIEVYDQNYQPVSKAQAFLDACLPAGFAPFNVFAHQDLILVSYAVQDADAHDDVKGAGNGFINAFNLEGRFKGRVISRGALNSPWGMTFVASKSEEVSFWAHPTQRLIVGNFGDGRIDVYDLSLRGGAIQADFLGPMVDSNGTAIVIDGLWGIMFGPGAGGFAAEDLFFTAGPDDEKHGLFGKLVFTQ